ncbi:putative holin-like toxin [Listeria grandensis]
MEVGTAIELMILFGMYTIALLTYVKNNQKKINYSLACTAVE